MPSILPSVPLPPLPEPIPIVISSILLLLQLQLLHLQLELLLTLLRALGHRLLQVLGPLRMRANLALRPVRTEPREIEDTQLPPHVLLRTHRPQRTEAHVVVRTRRQLRQRIDVQVQTLLAVGAVPVAHEEVALGHLAQVVLVQKLAVLALLAQPAQPVLAHERVEPARRLVLLVPAAAATVAVPARPGPVRHVPLRTARPVGAAARLEGLAYRSVRGQADLVCLSEEGREAEGVGLRGVVEDGVDVFRVRRCRGHCEEALW
ncbi:hypothetical protein V8C26DRAFT_391403 [Trichoderma gracile]